MKTMNNSIIALVAGALVAMSSCHKSDKTASPGQPPVIDVAVAVTDSVTLFKTYPGTLYANDAADVVCRVNGTLASQNYTSGAIVKKGQVLFTIDGSSYRNNLAEAQAQLSTARSNNQYAETHYTAVEAAFKRNAVSQMELAQALSNRDQSRASVKSAEAALAEATTDLGYCTISAPFDGRISSCPYSVGAYIAGDGNPVKMAQIYADATVDAYFHIEDASFLRMFSDHNNRHLINYDSVPISFSEKLPHSYIGSLYYIAPNVDPSTGALLVRCAIKNPYGELRQGMYVTIDLPYKVEPAAVLVRDASIGTDQLGKYVYVVNDSDKVVYTPISTGALVNDTMRVITKGLSAGQRYVTQAMLKVRDGMTVSPRLTNKQN